jgi:hypothetical protein
MHANAKSTFSSGELSFISFWNAAARDVDRRRWRHDIYIGISYIALLLRISTVRTQYLVLLYGILQNAAGLGPHRIQ